MSKLEICLVKALNSKKWINLIKELHHLVSLLNLCINSVLMWIDICELINNRLNCTIYY